MERLAESTAVLRVCGCPIGLWLSASNPDLSSLARRINGLESKYLALGAILADRLGTELVPRASLTSPERHLTLGIRRQLHRGVVLASSQAQDLVDLLRQRMRLPDVAKGMEKAIALSQEITTLNSTLLALAESEEVDLVRKAWDCLMRSTVLQQIVHQRSPRFFSEMAERTLDGTSWASKSCRRNGEYLWQIIDRAATKTTPRDWHTHVAMVSISLQADSGNVIANDCAATVWTENLHARRVAITLEHLQKDPTLDVALTPLYLHDGGDFVCWTIDRNDIGHMAEVRVRFTELLRTICATLEDGVLPVGQLAHVVANMAGESPELVHHFVEHLVELGILQTAPSPKEIVNNWLVLSDNVKPLSKTFPYENLAQHAFLDVYRQINTPLSFARCLQMQRGFEQVERILAAIESDQFGEGEKQTDDFPPLSLLSLVGNRLSPMSAIEDFRLNIESWPRPKSAHSAYGRLFQYVAQRPEAEKTVDLSKELLDSMEAPDGSIDWPVDCLFRIPQPATEFEAVLDEAFPAGSLDARFVDPLRLFHGTVSHADYYRKFLQQLEERSGVVFLELLVPPMSLGAANAVRRPLYTRAWTGDPDINFYCKLGDQKPYYVPLERINIRKTRGRLYADVNGKPVCGVYHATRIALPPWDVVAQCLLAATPFPISWSPRCLRAPLAAFAGRTFMPRITVAGKLVISCAQWKVPSNSLWAYGASIAQKIKRIQALRSQLGLPRWLFVSAWDMRKPVACDLESIRSIRTLERLAAKSKELRVVEMLPTPNQLLVREEGPGTRDYAASSIMLRFPYDVPSSVLAAKAAAAFCLRQDR